MLEIYGTTIPDVKEIKNLAPGIMPVDCLTTMVKRGYGGIICHNVPIQFNPEHPDFPLRVWDFAYNLRDKEGQPIYPEYTMNRPYLALFGHANPIPGAVTWNAMFVDNFYRNKIYEDYEDQRFGD